MLGYVLRPLIAMLSLIAIGWAASVIRTYSAEAPLADIAKAIVSDGKFNPGQLGAIERRIEAAPANLTEASAFSSAVVIRAFLLEARLNAGNRDVSFLEYNQLQLNVVDALNQSPTDGYMWLTAFWLKLLRAQPAASDLNLLRMSYWSGPNEAWIAIRRSSLALGLFRSLPPELADKAVSDFVGLVRSGFYPEAASALEGPGWAARDQLLSRLATVDLSDRRAFAKVLSARDIEGVSVPGVEAEPSRPF